MRQWRSCESLAQPESSPDRRRRCQLHRGKKVRSLLPEVVSRGPGSGRPTAQSQEQVHQPALM